MRIGVDIGNVIIGGGDVDTQFFTDDFLETPEVAGAWESLSMIRRHELHVISKCGTIVEDKSLKWLDVNGYYWSLKAHRIHFVRKRHLKAPMAQALELDVFIDDLPEIIESMQGIVKYPILFTSWEQTNLELEKIFAENR